MNYDEFIRELAKLIDSVETKEKKYEAVTKRPCQGASDAKADTAAAAAKPEAPKQTTQTPKASAANAAAGRPKNYIHIEYDGGNKESAKVIGAPADADDTAMILCVALSRLLSEQTGCNREALESDLVDLVMDHSLRCLMHELMSFWR